MYATVIPYVTLFAQLLLAVLSCVLAFLAVSGMEKSRVESAAQVKALNESFFTLQGGMDKLQPPQFSDLPEPETEESKQIVEMSPLRRSVSERVSWLQEFSEDVETCASSVGLAIAELTAGLWPPPAIEERLGLIQNKAQLTDLDNEVGRRAVQTVQVLLSKCDHDLDPSFSNTILQPAMLRLVKVARLRLIEPKHGYPFDKKLHTRLSLEPHTDEELRGTVASVRARGLIDPNNIVITRAEIREYD